MPQVGELWQSPRQGGRHTTRIWLACKECGKERWVILDKWKQGKCKICHPCFLKNHNPPKTNPPIGSRNANWKGGRRQRTGGYWCIKIYPKDNNYELVKSMIYRDGYISEHRYVMAVALGRVLKSSEIVHHLDGNRSNNKLENLKLTNWNDHDLSYKGGYEKGFTDGMAYAQYLKSSLIIGRYVFIKEIVD